MALSEFDWIERIVSRLGSSALGIGDDAAVLTGPDGETWVWTIDTLIENVHFRFDWLEPEAVGHRGLVASLSDLAAMGAEPVAALTAFAAPADSLADRVERLYAGLAATAQRAGCHVVGGDLSQAGEVQLTVTALGRCPGQVLTRDGARVGDLVYVTGTLGDSKAGLKILKTRYRSVRRARMGSERRHLRFLVKRHLRPSARIPEGQLLASRRLATAAIDLSDGLSGDLGHLCEQSRVGAEIEAASLPLSPATRWYAETRHLDPSDFALAGGEDYELLFTVSPANRRRLDHLARRSGFRFTRIGTIRSRTFGLQVRLPTGPPQAMIPSSYQHFRNHGAATGTGGA